MNDEGCQPLLRQMDAHGEPVERGLGRTIARKDKGVDVLHVLDGPRGGRDDGEAGRVGLLQQRLEGLQHQQRRGRVDLDGPAELVGTQLQQRLVALGHAARVGDQHVQVVDARGLDVLHGLGGVGLGRALNVHQQELGARGLGGGFEVCHVGLGAAHAADDDVVGAGEVGFGHAQTDAYWTVS